MQLEVTSTEPKPELFESPTADPAAVVRIGSNVQHSLVDTFGRVHRSMRVSVTDQCNIRCRYCMPLENVSFLPQNRLMSFSEIQRVVQVASSLGIEDYRLTGGEPLMRSNLADLIDMMVSTPKVRDVALTTNGMLLAKLLPDLADAGLRRINISLDTLSEDTFKILSRRVGLNRVLEGIEAALSDPRIVVRLNALVLRDINLKQVVELVRFATSRGVTIRFIEFMPLDADRTWNRGSVVTGKELRELLCSEIGAMQPCDRSNQAQPAIDYHFMDGSRVGFIDTVSEPFCGGCDRLRLTADGKLKNCLFGREEWDVLGILRTDALRDITTIDSRLADLLRDCCIAKARAHGINTSDFELSDRAMYQIGG